MSGPITRSNRTRVPVETPPRGRSRHGCWTCRIRRKKCDEQRAGEGLCGNCSRLQIDCLGWGERRPEWINDPAQLKAFKSSMKAQIRRHPRASSDPIPKIATPASPAPTDAPASAHPSSSKDVSHEEMFGLFPHLALPSSLIRPLPSSSMDPYNYRVFIEHVRILVNAANLPHICNVAFADTARLGEWKHNELDGGCLSYRELARRAIPIEKTLMDACEIERLSSISSMTDNVRHSKQEDKEDMLRFIIFADDDESRTSTFGPQIISTTSAEPSISLEGHAPLDVSVDIPIGPYIPFTPSESHTRASNAKLENQVGISASLTEAESSVPELVSLVPYLAGLLFLHSVVSGLNQKVPEILSTVERIVRLLMAEESSETLPKMQRLLAVALIGCLSDGDLATSLFNNVIATIDDNETAFNSAIALAQRGKEVDYAD